MEFTLTHPDTGLKQILVIFDGVPYEADSEHPWWDEIVRLCLADDSRVLDLFPIRPIQQPSEEIPWRAQDHESGDIDPALVALRAEEYEASVQANIDALTEFERRAHVNRWIPHNVEPAEEEQDDEDPTLADEGWPTGVI